MLRPPPLAIEPALARPSLRQPVNLVAGCAVLLSSLAMGPGQAWSFSLDDVTAMARELQQQPYQAPESRMPQAFRELPFADYVAIQPRRDRFDWAEADTPYRLAFYHQGMHFDTAVTIHEIVDGEIRELTYDPDKFHFGDLEPAASDAADLGYAGFRILYPINDAERHDEILSVLGASYYRVVGQDQVYGLSGRGLAIETALPHPEEFPDFREFWIERPGTDDDALVFYALLDSPRATGAYRYTLRPGAETTLDVESRVFLREEVAKLGIAPLTSMFLFGPHQPSPETSFRPALHDSNGLAIHTGRDEWLWRPLHNPKHLNVSTFQVDEVRGFGLLQRGREFWRYQDLADRYDLRPSAWVEPKGNWGAGVVELVEIPTPDETHDNIVAFWSPATPPKVGEMLTYDYRIHWTLNEPEVLNSGLGWVHHTMATAGEIRQADLIRQLDGSLGLVIDFEGPALADLPRDSSIDAVVHVGDNGELLDSKLEPNPVIDGWRLTLRVRIDDPAVATEMRAHLERDASAITETWAFQLPPAGLDAHTGGS